MAYVQDRRITRCLALVLALGLMFTVTACKSQSSVTIGDPQSGRALWFALSTAPTCGDPAQSGSNQTVYVARQIVDSLVDQDPKTGEITPW